MAPEDTQRGWSICCYQLGLKAIIYLLVAFSLWILTRPGEFTPRFGGPEMASVEMEMFWLEWFVVALVAAPLAYIVLRSQTLGMGITRLSLRVERRIGGVVAAITNNRKWTIHGVRKHDGVEVPPFEVTAKDEKTACAIGAQIGVMVSKATLNKNDKNINIAAYRRSAVYITAGVIVMVLALTVWPTPYRYVRKGDSLVCINRVTGRTQVLYGWQWVEVK